VSALYIRPTIKKSEKLISSIKGHYISSSVFQLEGLVAAVAEVAAVKVVAVVAAAVVVVVVVVVAAAAVALAILLTLDYFLTGYLANGPVPMY